MSLKPKNSGGGSSDSGTRSEPFVRVEPPRAGLRKARVSLIVELGEQNQDSLWEKDGKPVPEGTEGAVEKVRKACQQLAVFVDLVNDRRDYGGTIGEQPYRLMLNGEFAGKVKGINFAASPPMDAKGNRIDGGKWGFHPQNPLTKLAKACEREDIITEMDVEEFLGLPVMVDVEVKKTENKQGKKDSDGNVLVYTNINYKGAAKVPEDDDGNPGVVAPLSIKPATITFDNATPESVKFLRYSVRKYIKGANDYAGSNMQKAIEAYEATLGEKEDAPAEKPKATAPAKKTVAAKPKPAAKTGFDDMDDDVPFSFNLNGMGDGGSGKSKAGLRAKHGKGLSLVQANRIEF